MWLWLTKKRWIQYYFLVLKIQNYNHKNKNNQYLQYNLKLQSLIQVTPTIPMNHLLPGFRLLRRACHRFRCSSRKFFYVRVQPCACAVLLDTDNSQLLRCPVVVVATTWRDGRQPNLLTVEASILAEPAPFSDCSCDCATVSGCVVSDPSAWSHAEDPIPENRLAAAQGATWASSQTPRLGASQPTIVQPRKLALV